MLSQVIVGSTLKLVTFVTATDKDGAAGPAASLNVQIQDVTKENLGNVVDQAVQGGEPSVAFELDTGAGAAALSVGSAAGVA